MRLNLAGGILAVLVIVGLIIAYSAVFTVHQTRQALVVRLGEPVRIITEPGLNFKIPVIDSVIYIDKRILGRRFLPKHWHNSNRGGATTPRESDGTVSASSDLQCQAISTL